MADSVIRKKKKAKKVSVEKLSARKKKKAVVVNLRLSYDEYELLENYKEHSGMSRSEILRESLELTYKTDQLFARDYLNQQAEYETIDAREFERQIFHRYAVVIYLPKCDGELLAVKPFEWPKCYRNYTMRQFREKIILQCLARVVHVDILNQESELVNERITIGGYRERYIQAGYDISSIKTFKGVTEEYRDNL